MDPTSDICIMAFSFSSSFHYAASILGVGGGFMERGNVEYKDREDSDDEYDEVILILLTS